MLTAWPFHLTPVASSAVAWTRSCSFTTLACKNSNGVSFFFLITETANVYLKLLNLFLSHCCTLLNTVNHPQPVRYVTLQQPSRSTCNGDVFVSSCDDGVLRLFDIRRSVTAGMICLDGYKCLLLITFPFYLIVVLRYVFISAPVFESTKDDNDKIWSATFSPLDSMIIASACQNGVRMFDIRQNSFR